MTTDIGRVPDGTGLSSPIEPASGLAPSGFDPSREVLRCTFCAKTQHEVERLIAGPGVYICAECTELCGDIVREERKARPGSSSVPCPNCGERISMVAAVGHKQSWGITLRPNEGQMLQAATIAGAIDGAQKLMRLTCKEDGANVQTYVRSIATAADGSIAIDFASLPVASDSDGNPEGGDSEAAPSRSDDSAGRDSGIAQTPDLSSEHSS